MQNAMVVTDNFRANGFSNQWGHVDENEPGQITVATLASQGYQDSGAMFSDYWHPGFGYGTFSFTVATRFEDRGSPYVLLWDKEYETTGVEVDVMEIHGNPGWSPNGNTTFSANHWADKPGDDNWKDQYAIYEHPDGVDPRALHKYSVIWEPGKLTWMIDVTVVAQTTDHVPVDYDHGGSNLLPGIGMHLWPELVAQQHGEDNAMVMTEFSYEPYMFA